MANYSGIYLGFEGTTAECNTAQKPRETVYDTDSGLLRYMTADSGIVYLDMYDAPFGTGTSGYLPKWLGTTLGNSIFTDDGTDGVVSGALLVVDPLTIGSGLILNGKTISNNGNNKGITVDNDGWVGINCTPSNGVLEITDDTTAQIAINYDNTHSALFYAQDDGSLRIDTIGGGPVYLEGTGPVVAAKGLDIGYASIGVDYALRFIGYNGSGILTWVEDEARLRLSGGAFELNTVDNCPVDVDKFLVSSGGIVQYRTGAELLSDIGAGGSVGSGTFNYLPLWTSSGTLTDSIINQNENATQVSIFGSGLIEVEDSTSGTLLNLLTLRRLTTGTAQDGLGCGIRFQNEEKYGSIETIGYINVYTSGEYYIDLIPGYETSPTIRTRSGGATTIGRHTVGLENYVNFPLYGGPELVGNAKVNQTIPIPISELANGSTPPDPIVSGDMTGYAYDIGDDSTFVIRLPENYYQSATSDELDINIVYSTNEAYATASGEVQWQVEWDKYFYGGNTAPGSSAGSGTTAGGDENIPALAGGIQRKTITVSGVLQDDLFMALKLSRIALDDGTDPSSDPAILQIYATYLADALEE